MKKLERWAIPAPGEYSVPWLEDEGFWVKHEDVVKLEDLLDESKMECAVDCFTHDGCYCNCGAELWNKKVDECLGS